MGRRKKRKNPKKYFSRKKQNKRFGLPVEVQQKIWGIFLFVLGIITILTFFNKAGLAGEIFMKSVHFLIGNVVFIIPLILFLAGFIFLKTNYLPEKNKISRPIFFGVLVLLFGFSGVLATIDFPKKNGGWLGYILVWPVLKYFDFWVSLLIFSALIIIGILIFWYFLVSGRDKREQQEEIKISGLSEEEKIAPPPSSKKSGVFKKIFTPKFKVKEVPDSTETISPSLPSQTASFGELKQDKAKKGLFLYQPPPIDFLEKDSGVPLSGDTKTNSLIIKRTFQNFNIDVMMSEVNIGPTVTQYTFKPAEGIKLSRITALSNDLALALAAHPIRIEAPIPGRALVGVEVPNKTRAIVRLRSLIENQKFQKSLVNLTIPLGRDVSGFPVYGELNKMPHLLVAGATGTGKTIFLNSLIISLLYQAGTAFKSSSPGMLRFILVDPKRVEFPIYSNLPHLLCPVIYDASKTINALRWLTREMERRFDILKEAGVRNIGNFNKVAVSRKEEPLPFICVIIDELADLMAAKGREIEAGIVRLAQMARAVGIHLVVATQRPSVEVITGLIKANITSRVTFQVASQVDSRTILDCAGAEKLLGAGDMLYISAQVPKPKRIQSPYLSEKEIKKVVNYINSKSGLNGAGEMNNELIEELEKDSEKIKGANSFYDAGQEEDSLYEEAKRLVIESGRASASLLQRRLRLGYARAARLIDMLEERGIVGPAEGAKPREVYGEPRKKEQEDGRISVFGSDSQDLKENNTDSGPEDDFSNESSDKSEENKNDWHKI